MNNIIIVPDSLLTGTVLDSPPVSPESEISQSLTGVRVSLFEQKYTDLAIDKIIPNGFLITAGEFSIPGFGEQISNRREMTGVFEGAMFCARKIPFGEGTSTLITEVFFLGPVDKVAHNWDSCSDIDASFARDIEAVFADCPHFRSFHSLPNTQEHAAPVSTESSLLAVAVSRFVRYSSSPVAGERTTTGGPPLTVNQVKLGDVDRLGRGTLKTTYWALKAASCCLVVLPSRPFGCMLSRPNNPLSND